MERIRKRLRSRRDSMGAHPDSEIDRGYPLQPTEVDEEDDLRTQLENLETS